MKFNECNQLLPELVDDLDCAKMGRLNSYLQGMIHRACSGMELSREEQAQVLFCKFFSEHSSFALLTQDHNGLYSIAFVLDYEISRKERKAASRLVQRLLKESSKSWAAAFERKQQKLGY